MHTRILLVFSLLAASSSAQLPPKRPTVAIQKGAESTAGTEKTSSRQQPTTEKAVPGENQVNAPSKQNTTDAKASEELEIDRKLSEYTGQLATFTKYLVVVGALQFLALIGQGVVFWRTLNENRRLIQASRRVADAALAGAQAASINANAAVESNALTRESNATMAQATELTRQSFLFANRPRLIIRNVSVNDIYALFHPQPTEPVRGSFFIANSGTGQGHITSVDCGVYRGDTLPMVPPFTTNGQNPDRLLPPGKGTGWPFEALLPEVEIGEIKGILDQTANVYVIGRIGYTDDLGTMRSTAFCRKWDKDSRRFFAVDDQDYEHAE